MMSFCRRYPPHQSPRRVPPKPGIGTKLKWKEPRKKLEAFNKPGLPGPNGR